MAPGESPASPGEDATYGADEAAGWDECCPTVSTCDARGTPWKRVLRDHGDVWGRPWEAEVSASTISARFEGPDFTLVRIIALENANLTVDYALTNTRNGLMPFMWSQHALLAVHPGDTIEMSGVKQLATTHLTAAGRRYTVDQVAWPEHGLGIAPPRLDRVSGPETRFAGKFYTRVEGAFRAKVGNDNASLEIGWSAAELPYVGLWLNYGGWPGQGAFSHHIAIEPATAPVDHLCDAIAGGYDVRLEHGEVCRWRVALRHAGQISAHRTDQYEIHAITASRTSRRRTWKRGGWRDPQAFVVQIGRDSMGMRTASRCPPVALCCLHDQDSLSATHVTSLDRKTSVSDFRGWRASRFAGQREGCGRTPSRSRRAGSRPGSFQRCVRGQAVWDRAPLPRP